MVKMPEKYAAYFLCTGLCIDKVTPQISLCGVFVLFGIVYDTTLANHIHLNLSRIFQLRFNLL